MDWNSLGSLMDSWKEGQEGYLTVSKQGKLKSPEELGYYYSVILPCAFEAFKQSGEFTLVIAARDKSYELPLDKLTTDLFLKSRYGKWHGEYKNKGDMNMAECAAFMDWTILWLAQHYNCQIPPADPHWRDNLEA